EAVAPPARDRTADRGDRARGAHARPAGALLRARQGEAAARAGSRQEGARQAGDHQAPDRRSGDGTRHRLAGARQVRLLLAASLVLAWSAPPSVLQVSTRGGVERIALRQDVQHGALVPLAPLARAVGATIEQRPPWVVLTAKSARFRFLAGTPLVADGEEMRPLPAPTVQLGDTTWVPP